MCRFFGLLSTRHVGPIRERIRVLFTWASVSIFFSNKGGGNPYLNMSETQYDSDTVSLSLSNSISLSLSLSLSLSNSLTNSRSPCLALSLYLSFPLSLTLSLSLSLSLAPSPSRHFSLPLSVYPSLIFSCKLSPMQSRSHVVTVPTWFLVSRVCATSSQPLLFSPWHNFFRDTGRSKQQVSNRLACWLSLFIYLHNDDSRTPKIEQRERAKFVY